MTTAEIKAMSIEELKELAKEKGRKGNASTNARRAQEELVRRNGGAVCGNHFKSRWSLSDEGGKPFVKKFKEDRDG